MSFLGRLQRCSFLLVLSFVIASCAAEVTQEEFTEPSDPVTYFSKDDAEMNAAISAARGTLESFFAILQNDRRIESPLLKVAVPNSEGGAEHIWMKPASLDDPDKFVAIVDNRPAKVPSLQLGDFYEFSADQISDWSYVKDGKLHGGYTIRVILGRMSKDEADQFKIDFAPLP